MGMSASQARLLTLTARQHDVEWKAQKLQAEKLRLANDSDGVYNAYLAALSTTKIQARVYDKWEGDTFKDATLAMLENGVVSGYTGETAATPLFLQEISTGRLMITPEYAASIGVTTDIAGVGNQTLDEFLYEAGHTKTRIVNTTYPLIKDPDVNNYKVVSFKGVANSALTPYSSWYSNFTPVENDNTGGFDESELAKYASFNSTHNYSVTGTAVSSVGTFTSGQTYTISNAADLEQLRKLSQEGVSTSGVTFVLKSDIDLTGYDWNGINNFQGNFDGNGYTISNLSGTQGLFASTGSGEVKNIKLENVDIKGNSINVGGLIGYANSTKIQNISVSGSVQNDDASSFTHDHTSHNANIGTGGVVGFYYGEDGATTTIYNISSKVDVTAAGYNAGGVLGCYFIQHNGSYPNFNNVYSTGTIDGSTNVGGITGYYKVDPDRGDEDTNTIINTDASNMLAAGKVIGDENVGGFTGVLSCWDDNGDSFSFTGIVTTAKVEGEKNAGIFIGNNNAVTNSTDADFIKCEYASNVNSGLDLVGKVSSGTATIPETGGGIEPFMVAAKIPSINADGTGSYYSNIIGVLIKAGLYDPANITNTEKTTMENNVKDFLSKFNDDTTDNTKLYYLNEKICEYLNAADNSGDEAFAQALYNDVINGTTSNTATYQIGDNKGSIKRSTDDLSWDQNIKFNENLGTLTIPNLNTIKKELAYSLMIVNNTLTQSQAESLAQNFLNTYTNVNNATDSDARNTDRAYLAKVNEILKNFSDNGVYNNEVQTLLKSVESATKYTVMPDGIDDISHFNISINGTEENVSVNKEAPLIEDTANPIHEYDWDWDNPDIIASVNKYNTLKTGFIIIGDATKSADYDSANMHKSTNWLTNVINAGIAQFVKYDYEAFKQAKTNGTATENIDLIFTGTSTANETSIQEVQDTENIKKAEATYEANMRKINRKETKIDTELSTLEAERTSIKAEQDTLKTVAKDNISLTFKLFS